MKKALRRRAALALTVLLLFVFCTGGLSVLADDESIPTVECEKQSIMKGSPFSATFDFSHTLYNKNSYKKITISVSSPNGAISLKKKTFSSDNDEIDTSTGDSSISYRLTIPELYMKRIGDGAGTLKFSISYYDGNDIRQGTFTTQKTVFDPTGTSSTTEDQGKLVVQSYRLDHTPVKEGEKFTLTFTLKNTGSVVCDNIMAVLDTSTAEGVSINGVTDTQYINSLDTGATATISYPMTCLSKMATNNYAASLILSADELS